jgi:hypothetical protein
MCISSPKRRNRFEVRPFSARRLPVPGGRGPFARSYEPPAGSRHPPGNCAGVPAVRCSLPGRARPGARLTPISNPHQANPRTRLAVAAREDWRAAAIPRDLDSLESGENRADHPLAQVCAPLARMPPENLPRILCVAIQTVDTFGSGIENDQTLGSEALAFRFRRFSGHKLP